MDIYLKMFRLFLRPRRICPLLDSSGFQLYHKIIFHPAIHKKINSNVSQEKSNLITEN